MAVGELSRMLSAVSHDLRVLESSQSASAKGAIDYFVCRIRMEIGSLAAVLDGLDALIFTDGIDENSSQIRAAALAGMEWLD
jgi:acetate kinase